MGRYSLKTVLVLIGVFFGGVSCVYAQTAGEYIQSGNDSLKQRDFNQAIYDYTKAIDINPNLAKAYDNRGVAYAEQGFLAPAIADFTMALAININDAEAYNNRGHAYSWQGDLPKAIADYSKAIRINAIYVKAYNNRALAYFGLKDYDKAWADVHKVQKLGGTVDPDLIESLKKESAQDQ